jgi:DNA-binding beta-propeller fold protein YncE
VQSHEGRKTFTLFSGKRLAYDNHPMKFLLSSLLLLTLSLSNHAWAAADAILTPSKPIELTGTHGKFDFIKVDATRRRLLACHTGNGTLDVIDLATSKIIASVPTGNAQGVAIDDKGGRYFVSCSKPPKLVIVDADKLTITGQVPLPAPADLCAYSAKLNWVFVDNDEKPEMWEIDLNSMSVLHAWQLAPDTGMEDLALDSTGTVLVQNIKNTSKLSVLDFAKNPIFAGTGPVNGNNPTPDISTLPAEKPHGLAMAEGNTVLIAGGAGKLVLLDYQKGQVIASCDIAPKVDEIAYDSGLGRVYSASGTGVISVTFVGANTLSSLGSIPSAPGAHSIAVDPKTHTVWIAYAKDSTPYIQSFTAK